MDQSPLTPEGELALNAMLVGMKIKGVLTDEMIIQEEGEIILGKPFTEWPPELQAKLAPTERDHGFAEAETYEHHVNSRNPPGTPPRPPARI